MFPSVEILIPVYNRKDLILKSVNSGLNQTYRNVFVSVFDNASNDGTWEKLKKINNKKLRLFRNQKNIGLFENFNNLIRVSKCDFCIFLCSDDWLEENFVEKGIKYFLENRNIVMLSSACKTFNEKNKTKMISNYLPFKEYSFDEILLNWFEISFKSGVNPFSYPSGMLIKGDILRNNIFFDSKFGSPADIVFFLDVLENGNVFFTEYLGANILLHSNQANRSFRKDGSLINSNLMIINKYKQNLKDNNLYEAILVYSFIPVLKILIRNFFDKESCNLSNKYLRKINYKNIKFFYFKVFFALIIRLKNFVRY